MSTHVDIGELDRAVIAYATAVREGDLASAKRFVSERAFEAGSAAAEVAATKQPFVRFDVLARARYERQFIVKVRWRGESGPVTWQTRWDRDGGSSWRIVEVEDLTPQPVAEGAPAPATPA